MKQVILGLGLVLALAACGGGGSTGGPNPLPSTTPKTVYTAQIRFVGQLAGATIQSDLRRAQSLEPMAANTPIPIMVVSPMTAQDTIGNISGARGFGGWVQAIVSPVPTSSPAVTFSSTNPNAVYTSVPNTPPPGNSIVAQQAIGSNSGAVNAQSSGTATATIGNPVNEAPSTQVYTYRAISLECASPMSAGSSPAWAWDGATWNAVSTIANADIYMTGPYCDAPFNSAESETTIHFPGGGITISTDTPFSGITASQLTGATLITSADLAALITKNGDGSNNGDLLWKTTHVPATVKLFPNGISRGAQPDYSGAIEVSGSSVDGF